ncbi:hypothetical protein [Planctomycetes bacterium Pan216]|uniref:hypothetical protein n=1 Tax=Kolteria novifilia TaxID=2527975 RepID=UPI00119E6ED6
MFGDTSSITLAMEPNLGIYQRLGRIVDGLVVVLGLDGDPFLSIGPRRPIAREWTHSLILR